MSLLLISAQAAREVAEQEIVTLEDLYLFATRSIRFCADKGYKQATFSSHKFLDDNNIKDIVEREFKEKGYDFMWLDRKSTSVFFISWAHLKAI